MTRWLAIALPLLTTVHTLLAADNLPLPNDGYDASAQYVTTDDGVGKLVFNIRTGLQGLKTFRLRFNITNDTGGKKWGEGVAFQEEGSWQYVFEDEFIKPGQTMSIRYRVRTRVVRYETPILQGRYESTGDIALTTLSSGQVESGGEGEDAVKRFQSSRRRRQRPNRPHRPPPFRLQGPESREGSGLIADSQIESRDTFNWRAYTDCLRDFRPVDCEHLLPNRSSTDTSTAGTETVAPPRRTTTAETLIASKKPTEQMENTTPDLKNGKKGQKGGKPTQLPPPRRETRVEIDVATIVIGTVVPVVVVIGVIVVVFLIVKHRRRHHGPFDQPTFSNINYHTTNSATLPPPQPPSSARSTMNARRDFQSPTDECEYTYAGEIYEEISGNDEGLMKPSMAADWGSDTYEDPDKAAIHNRGPLPLPPTATHENSTYADSMYIDPEIGLPLSPRHQDTSQYERPLPQQPLPQQPEQYTVLGQGSP